MIMTNKNPKPPVKKNQAPIDENPLAKPDKSKKELLAEKKAKSRTLKDDDWKI